MRKETNHEELWIVGMILAFCSDNAFGRIIGIILLVVYLIVN